MEEVRAGEGGGGQAVRHCDRYPSQAGMVAGTTLHKQPNARLNHGLQACGLPPGVRYTAAPKRLPEHPLKPAIRLNGPDGARVEVSPLGAQVLSWVDSSGRERFFLSPNAVFAPGQAIRGGVPVVFPQFSGRGPLKKHGFARGLPWSPRPVAALPDGCSRLSLELESCAETRGQWPHDFQAAMEITLGASELEMRLHVRNTGSAPFSFTAALHSYLAASLSDARLLGLAGRPYEDAADGGRWRVQRDDTVEFGEEVDRVYPEVGGELALVSDGQRLRIGADGFRDVVVWNPGPALAAALPDLGDGHYAHFVCVEAANVLHPVVLSPGESWSGAQILSA